MIAIDVINDTATPWFGKMMARIGQPGEVLESIGAAVANSTKLRFNDGRAPDGTPWAAVLRGGRPLRDTGVHLMNAVTYRVEGSTVLVGVPPAWASVHQFGATIRAKNVPYLRFKVGNRWARKKQVTIPARPFLGLSEDDENEISLILLDAIKP